MRRTTRCCRSATTSRWGRARPRVALDLLGNPPCVPCHYATFPLLTGTPEQLQIEAPNATILKLGPGDTMLLD